eukprot:Gb_13363 [translate_table: standard]
MAEDWKTVILSSLQGFGCSLADWHSLLGGDWPSGIRMAAFAYGGLLHLNSIVSNLKSCSFALLLPIIESHIYSGKCRCSAAGIISAVSGNNNFRSRGLSIQLLDTGVILAKKMNFLLRLTIIFHGKMTWSHIGLLDFCAQLLQIYDLHLWRSGETPPGCHVMLGLTQCTLTADLLILFLKNNDFIADLTNTWIIGKWAGYTDQKWAPTGTYFHQFTLPKIIEFRKDCTYGDSSALILPDEAQGVNCCEYTMPRRAIHACHAGGVIHALEGYGHHEVGAIDVDRIDVVWDAAMKYGFRPVPRGTPTIDNNVSA